MTRRRWGDRVADNDLVDRVMGACFRLTVIGIVVGAVLFSAGVLWALAAGVAPPPYSIQLESSLQLVILSLNSSLAVYLATVAIAIALTPFLLTAAIILLNEVDKIVVHGRL